MDTTLTTTSQDLELLAFVKLAHAAALRLDADLYRVDLAAPVFDARNGTHVTPFLREVAQHLDVAVIRLSELAAHLREAGLLVVP